MSGTTVTKKRSIGEPYYICNHSDCNNYHDGDIDNRDYDNPDDGKNDNNSSDDVNFGGDSIDHDNGCAGGDDVHDSGDGDYGYDGAVGDSGGGGDSGVVYPEKLFLLVYHNNKKFTMIKRFGNKTIELGRSTKV
ncbi:Hypothetical predicted protein [Paramuricea clavata]|uniref:Uncharacterized protein n=1 Tax=Paramuricea clavata TaxID=317549 RepID=A0A7D9JEW0_PARCT|nr:Hypothetical predicted protein [Paramuricea clavata]